MRAKEHIQNVYYIFLIILIWFIFQPLANKINHLKLRYIGSDRLAIYKVTQIIEVFFYFYGFLASKMQYLKILLYSSGVNVRCFYPSVPIACDSFEQNIPLQQQPYMGSWVVKIPLMPEQWFHSSEHMWCTDVCRGVPLNLVIPSFEVFMRWHIVLSGMSGQALLY